LGMMMTYTSGCPKNRFIYYARGSIDCFPDFCDFAIFAILRFWRFLHFLAFFGGSWGGMHLGSKKGFSPLIKPFGGKSAKKSIFSHFSLPYSESINFRSGVAGKRGAKTGGGHFWGFSGFWCFLGFLGVCAFSSFSCFWCFRCMSILSFLHLVFFSLCHFVDFAVFVILLFCRFCCFHVFVMCWCCVDVRLPPDLAFSVFFNFAFFAFFFFSIYPACIRIEGIGQETCRYDPSLRAGRACGYVIYALHFPDFMTCLRWWRRHSPVLRPMVTFCLLCSDWRVAHAAIDVQL
jgi:hypothetical protein